MYIHIFTICSYAIPNTTLDRLLSKIFQRQLFCLFFLLTRYLKFVALCVVLSKVVVLRVLGLSGDMNDDLQICTPNYQGNYKIKLYLDNTKLIISLKLFYVHSLRMCVVAHSLTLYLYSWWARVHLHTIKICRFAFVGL